VYVHVLDWPDRQLAIPALGATVRRASLLAGGQPVPFVETASGVTLTLPIRSADQYDQVVVLETRR
jgi:hypothetical protein